MESEKKKTLSRWDECFNEKSPVQCTLNPSHQQTLLVYPSVDNIFVQEFLPQTADDPIFSILRELFIHSFDEFYKEIEIQLNLKTNTSVAEWLNDTFDGMQDEILNRKQRCFILCSNDETMKKDRKQGLIGFLTLTEEEKGSVYIAQFAIDAENKRRGYGTRLLQHLRAIYPLGTSYQGLCRRANKPAVKFYLKHGAKFMEDEEIAVKYAYDPELYTGFQFIDGVPIHTQSNASETSAFLSNCSTMTSSPESTLTRRLHVTFQDSATMTDSSLESIKHRTHQKMNCCVLS